MESTTVFIYLVNGCSLTKYSTVAISLLSVLEGSNQKLL